MICICEVVFSIKYAATSKIMVYVIVVVWTKFSPIGQNPVCHVPPPLIVKIILLPSMQEPLINKSLWCNCCEKK